MQALEASRPSEIEDKSPARLLEEYCLSTLVLGAQFRFRPVPQKDYYLYRHLGQWELSLVGPAEWGLHTARVFVARCVLKLDMTWLVDIDSRALRNEEITQCLQDHATAWSQAVHEAGSVEEGLPTYVAALPYYQRVLASGLAASLKHSILRLDGPARAKLEILALPSAAS